MSDLPDLVELAGGPKLSSAERRRLFKKRSTPFPRGHAAQPGLGPKGETCGSCANLHRKQGARRYFLKCLLAKHKWTGGGGSDVRAKDAACTLWSKRVTEGEAA